MKYSTFSTMWDHYVVKLMLSESIGSVHQAFLEKRISYSKNCVRNVHNMYERTKQKFKEFYFADAGLSRQEICTIDRHKRAALICYSFNEVSPLIYNGDSCELRNDFYIYLVNQYFALHFGLCSMLLDYTPESINRAQCQPLGSGSAKATKRAFTKQWTPAYWRRRSGGCGGGSCESCGNHRQRVS